MTWCCAGTRSNAGSTPKMPPRTSPRRPDASAPTVSRPGPAQEDELQTVSQAYTVEVSGKRFEVKVIGPPFAGGSAVASNGSASAATKRAPRRSGGAGGGAGGGGDTLASPLQGTVLKVA